ncbi:MAG: nucleotidyl transferase AbiEii/AbiGii toxin family protein [Acidobacteriota bacterium]
MKHGYQRVITSPPDDRRDLFIATARRLGTTEQNVEKDFWVCWTLDALFQGRQAGAPRLLFKGGTSLSKAFGLIQRFSEDIDITVFGEDLGEPASIDELEKLSRKKRRAKLDEIRTACQRYLVEDLRPRLAAQLAEAISPSASADVIIDELDPDRQTVLVRYPSVFAADPYVRAVARIECGAKSALDPHGLFVVTPYVAAEIPNLDLTVADVTTILPERTFWDKVVIVHGLRAWFERRDELRQEGQRVSRHYYDLHSILPTDVAGRALSDLALGRECIRHAAVFFGRPDFDLDAAASGHFALSPGAQMLDGLRRDYDAMAGMIFRDTPRFDDVLASIAILEVRLNRQRF